MRALAWLGVSAVGSLAIAASCTFPEIDVLGGTGAAAAQGSSTTSGTAGSGAGAGASTSSGSGAASGSGGAGGGGAGTGGDPCAMKDKDGDGHENTLCGGDDCNDFDGRVFPDAGTYQTKPTDGGKPLPFDFNCDSDEERDPDLLLPNCPSMPVTGCTVTKYGFKADAPCGTTLDYVACQKNVAGLACEVVDSTTATQIGCR